MDIAIDTKVLKHTKVRLVSLTRNADTVTVGLCAC
jgi:hypothetical protein